MPTKAREYAEYCYRNFFSPRSKYKESREQILNMLQHEFENVGGRIYLEVIDDVKGQLNLLHTSFESRVNEQDFITVASNIETEDLAKEIARKEGGTVIQDPNNPDAWTVVAPAE